MDYQLCGRRIASDIVIPELSPWMGDDQPAGTHVRQGEPPEALEQPTFATPFLEIAADGTSLVTVMGGRFLTRNGREIIVRPNPAADPQDLSVFLLGPSLGLLLHQRGLFPRPASGVAIGKSTLAARGHELLADDIWAIASGPQGDRLLAAPGADESAPWTVLEEAAAADFVCALPQGLDMVVGERQRLAIARALLRHPRRLILDAAPSALDGGSEALVLRTLDRRRGQITILAVIHRDQTRRAAGLVLELDEGRGVRLGPADESRAVAGTLLRDRADRE